MKVACRYHQQWHQKDFILINKKNKNGLTPVELPKDRRLTELQSKDETGGTRIKNKE